MSATMTTEKPAARTDWAAKAQTLAQEFSARAAEHDAEDSFVADNYARLKAEGFFKACVPVEFGGGGAARLLPIRGGDRRRDRREDNHSRIYAVRRQSKEMGAARKG